MKPTVPPEPPALTRVQCGKCAWTSGAHESVADAYLEVGAHFVNVHRYASPTPAAAPPTVAPARPAQEAVQTFWGINLDVEDHRLSARDVVRFLERDRASRSPGVHVAHAADADFVRRLGRAIDQPIRGDHEGWTHGRLMDEMAYAALDFLERETLASALRGQEGKGNGSK